MFVISLAKVWSFLTKDKILDLHLFCIWMQTEWHCISILVERDNL